MAVNAFDQFDLFIYIRLSYVFFTTQLSFVFCQ